MAHVGEKFRLRRRELDRLVPCDADRSLALFHFQLACLVDLQTQFVVTVPQMLRLRAHLGNEGIPGEDQFALRFLLEISSITPKNTNGSLVAERLHATDDRDETLDAALSGWMNSSAVLLVSSALL